MSGTSFRKGDRIYSPLCGFATVISARVDPLVAFGVLVLAYFAAELLRPFL